MALKDNVLKSFFDSNIKSRNNINRYRVFDDPTQLKKHLAEDFDKNLENLNSNLTKPEHETDSNKRAIREQTDSNKGAIGEQTDSNKGAIGEQTDSNKGAIGELKRERESEKISKSYSNNNSLCVDNPLDLITKIQQLYGHQRKILFFIVERCTSRGLLTSGPINNMDLCTLCKTTYGTIKNAIKRLILKDLILRGKSKKGKGGFSCFDLREDVKNIAIESTRQIKIELLQIEQSLGIIREQIGSNKGAEKGAKQFLSSGGSIDLKTTTTNSNPARELPEGWRNVEYSLLAHIGFTQIHLLQLSKLEPLEPSIVQDSIYHFAFDLKHNNKASSIKGDPLNYFMGIVSKRGAYTAPSNYIDPVLETLNAYHKTKEQSEKQKTEIEQKVQEIEFKNWHDSLSDNEILALIPDEICNSSSSGTSFKQTMKTQFLKKYYRETLWPERRRALCSATANWATIEPLSDNCTT